jgi:glycosyltransferase involved in cell wall biosynthesis
MEINSYFLLFLPVMIKRRVIVSATNDLATDQRVSRLCRTLCSDGFEVMLTGRILPESLPLTELPYKTRRVRHWFNKKMFFYAEYNIRLFFYLLFTSFDILHSNDLDTLPANYLASRIKRKPLVYDTHEYFTEMPGLYGRPAVKKIWEFIERKIFPHIQIIITVNDSIAEIYREKYSRHIHVVRNLPERITIDPSASPSMYGLPENKKLIIMQGRGINRDRGAEEAIYAMQHIDNAVLVIAGDGDIVTDLKKLVIKEKSGEKVYFIPPVPYKELMKLTSICHCGLSLDKDTSLNYRFSLPNKLFDYIMAEIPVLASSLPEVRKIVDQYSTGLLITEVSPRQIAEKLKIILFDIPKDSWKEKLLKAKEELNWDKEKHRLSELYMSLSNNQEV